jgi:hypothetical protein
MFYIHSSQSEPVGEVYLYSAVATPNERWDQFTGITINVWDGSQNKAFDCCLFSKNNIPEYINSLPLNVDIRTIL